MTRARQPAVLVTGATGRVGRAVVDQLITAGVPVRAVTDRSEAAGTLPGSSRSLPATSPSPSRYVLTGRESLSQAVQVSIIADVVGRRVQYVDRSFRQWVTDHAAAFSEDPMPSS